jgi:hypothetical protein
MTAKDQLLSAAVLCLVMHHASLSRAFATGLRGSRRLARDIFPRLPRSSSRAAENFPDAGVADATTHWCGLDD